MRRLICLVIAVIFLAGPAIAGLDDGLAAWRRGDYGNAFRQLLPVAKAGHPVAQYHVGRMWDAGKGTDRNRAKAAHWYRQAAARGHPDAQYRLGNLYAEGLGVPLNPAAAAKWHRRAANQGHVQAQARIGRLYAEGHPGLAQDRVRAWKWLTLAARSESANASQTLEMLASAMSASDLAKAQGMIVQFQARPE